MFATSSSLSDSLHRNPAPLQTSACQHQHSRLQPRKKPGPEKGTPFRPKDRASRAEPRPAGLDTPGLSRNGSSRLWLVRSRTGSARPAPGSDMRLRPAGQANFRPALKAETSAPTQRRRRAARSHTPGTARACGPTCKTTARRNLPQPYCVQTGSTQAMCHT